MYRHFMDLLSVTQVFRLGTLLFSVQLSCSLHAARHTARVKVHVQPRMSTVRIG